MKKSSVVLLLLSLFFLLIGCFNTTSQSTANNASPQNVLKSNPNTDFFIMDNTVYMNAANVDWVAKLTLKEGKALGKINKTGVDKNFKDWNATKLKIDTEIYELEGRKDIVLVKVDNKYIPYLKYVEG